MEEKQQEVKKFLLLVITMYIGPKKQDKVF